jgi:hypothetical protein
MMFVQLDCRVESGLQCAYQPMGLVLNGRFLW